VECDKAPAHVLIVVQPRRVASIRLMLEHCRADVRPAQTGAAIADNLVSWNPHLAIVESGASQGAFVEQLGQASRDFPALAFLVLTPRGDLKATLRALDAGAQDVLPVPFLPDDLVARALLALRRRHPGLAAFRPAIRVGKLEIDILAAALRLDGRCVRLTPNELSLIYLFAASGGRTVGREELVEPLWGADWAPGPDVVDRQVESLAAKLAHTWPGHRFVVSVPGRGYRYALDSDGPASDES
jgi:two-component system KDP operon response regulator KdpE